MADPTQGTGDVIARVTGSIDFGKILGLPLSALMDACQNNAKQYMQFIKDCLDENGNPITVSFTRKERDDKGNDTYKLVEIPLLAIVQHPNLTIDEFVDEFNLEISDTFTQEVQADASGGATATVGWGFLKVSAEVKFSSHYGQTRKTDTRAKHTVSVKAHQAGTSEGMSRVIDWLTDGIGKNTSQADSKDNAGDKGKGK